MSNQKICNQWMAFVNDDKYKIYFMSNEDEWNNNLKRIKQYIDENNKKPSRKDKNKEIKFMGLWICNQWMRYKTKTKIMSRQEIYDRWTAFTNDNKYKMYFSVGNKSWMTKLNLIKQYITKNNKRPSQQDKNKEIKMLGKWISYHQTNYKTKTQIMKDPFVRNHFTRFLTEHKQYFPNVEIHQIILKLNKIDPNLDDMLENLNKYIENGKKQLAIFHHKFKNKY
jgi:hypothetical protein